LTQSYSYKRVIESDIICGLLNGADAKDYDRPVHSKGGAMAPVTPPLNKYLFKTKVQWKLKVAL